MATSELIGRLLRAESKIIASGDRDQKRRLCQLLTSLSAAALSGQSSPSLVEEIVQGLERVLDRHSPA